VRDLGAPETVIAYASRAYIVGMIRRPAFETMVAFALKCEQDGYRVGWPFGLPYVTEIEAAEESRRRELHPVRRSWFGLARTLRAAV